MSSLFQPTLIFQSIPEAFLISIHFLSSKTGEKMSPDFFEIVRIKGKVAEAGGVLLMHLAISRWTVPFLSRACLACANIFVYISFLCLVGDCLGVKKNYMSR